MADAIHVAFNEGGVPFGGFRKKHYDKLVLSLEAYDWNKHDIGVFKSAVPDAKAFNVKVKALGA